MLISAAQRMGIQKYHVLPRRPRRVKWTRFEHEMDRMIILFQKTEMIFLTIRI